MILRRPFVVVWSLALLVAAVGLFVMRANAAAREPVQPVYPAASIKGEEFHTDAEVAPPPPTGVTVPPPAQVAPPGSDAARRQELAAAAKKALALAESDSNAIAAKIVSVTQAREAVMADAEALAARRTLLAARLGEAEADLRRHALSAYTRGSASEVAALLRAAPMGENGLRQVLSDTVLRFDAAALERLRAESAEAGGALRLAVEESEHLRAEIAGQRERLEKATQDEVAARASAQVLGVSASRDGGDFRFPIAGPYTFRNDWHDPRGGGTRLHLGNDLFADRGTPLVAIERGVIANKGYDGNGGNGLWLVGQSGTRYYYAHMDVFETGIADGTVVEAGQKLGTVGDSGNARGGAPHCHFQVHPGGGEPVNPYPFLALLAEKDPNNRGSGA